MSVNQLAQFFQVCIVQSDVIFLFGIPFASQIFFSAMYQGITDVLNKYDVPLTNCVGICLDNTNANMGCSNLIRTRITKDNPSVYVNGCICHILHNAARKGSATLRVCKHTLVS